jgi:adenylate cyclase
VNARLLRRPLRLQDRIVLFFAVLLVLVQAAAFYFIRQSSESTARSAMRQELRVAERVFNRLLAQNAQRLVEASRVLAADFGFRAAVATQESETIAEALRNHSGRIRASGMAMVSLEGRVIADTLDNRLAGQRFPHAELVTEASREGQAWGVRMRGDQAYQVAVLPVLAPLPIAWIAVSFVIDDAMARDLRQLASAEVSFARRGRDGTRLLASTLTAPTAQALAPGLADLLGKSGYPTELVVAGEEYEALAVVLDPRGGDGIHAVLQRPVAEALASITTLQALLALVALASIAVTLVGAVRIARQVTQPVTELAKAAREVALGNYDVRVTAASDDEVGELAAAFNGMTQGLRERDKMRDVLGKVTSVEVAEQLLGGGVELGGAELEAAVMFTDIRNFTPIAQSLSPHDTLALLNRYLAVMNEVVEAHGGVVDKYMGDGAMALFGAPVPRPGDTQRALEAALEMQRRIDALRNELALAGKPHPAMGIGLNCSRVIAGNIGSASRLNYTVLGDGVNLAARLESLTKRYFAPIVVGDNVRQATQGIVYRELDKVRVRGRTLPERIFEPLGREGTLTIDERVLLEHWTETLEHYRARRWRDARAGFETLVREPRYQRVSSLHLGYLKDLDLHPPGDGWDAAFTLYDK